MNRRLAIFIASSSLSVALVAWERIDNRRRSEALVKRAEAAAAEHEAFLAHLEALNEDLGKRLETAKFWSIVTHPDNN